LGAELYLRSEAKSFILSTREETKDGEEDLIGTGLDAAL
jgi:hypothetical protein